MLKSLNLLSQLKNNAWGKLTDYLALAHLKLCFVTYIDLHLVNGKTEFNDITVKCTEFGEQVRNSTKRADALQQQQMQVYSYPLTEVMYLQQRIALLWGLKVEKYTKQHTFEYGFYFKRLWGSAKYLIGFKNIKYFHDCILHHII